MICSKCAKEIPEGSQFCLQCGSPVKTQHPAKKKQNTALVAVLLLIIVGCAAYLIVNGYIGEPVADLGRAVGISDQNFTIRVTGDKGLAFHGSYMTVSSGGTSTSQSVEGTTPAVYSTTGKIVSTSFQKKNETGTLRVEILRGVEVVKQASTTAAYGVVTAATN
jgi:predicted nucleic acid-binding Zn ribbon protein